MSAHARLSPSASHQWIPCPGSISLCEQLGAEDSGSVFAQEGTAAHALGELKASLALGFINVEQYNAQHEKWAREWAYLDADWAAMEMHTDRYAEYIVATRDEMGPDTAVFLERRVYPGIPECYGTADVILVSPTEVRSIDLKYGMGVAVEAEGNSQVRLYLVGALDEFGDIVGTTETVTGVVYQPRLNSITSETLTADSLREWRDSIIPIAESAIAGSDVFAPSDKSCRFCNASGRCRAQMEAIFADPLPDESTVHLLSLEELAESLKRVPLVKAWMSAVEETALNLIYAKKQDVPGFKVVQSAGRRVVQNHTLATQALLAEGFTEDQFLTKKVKGIGDLTTMLGEDEFYRILEKPGIVSKSEGKPTLVADTDSRPSTDPTTEAQRVFGGENT